MKQQSKPAHDFRKLLTNEPLETVEQFVEKQELTKHERFLKYAGGRVAQALRAIKNLGNCANPANYEYSQDEVDLMFNQLRETLAETEKKFTPRVRQKFGRNFFQNQDLTGDER